MRPLYHNKQVEELEAEGNRGLFWNKFINKWPSQAGAPMGNGERAFKPLGGENKTEWIKEFVGPSSDAGNAADRIRKLVETLDGRCQTLKTTAPFVTGMGLAHPVENGFLWHHTLGVPYLPGSSVKGLVRAWAEYWEGADKGTINSLFGKETTKEVEGYVGSLIFFDAFPTEGVKLIAEVMTPHDGGWRQGDNNETAPSDWHSPVPIPFLAIASGAHFQFCIAPRPGSEATGADAETAMQWLEEALKWLGAGAKTAVGFGRFGDDPGQKGGAAGGGVQQPAIRIGDRVADEYGETGEVIRIEGDKAIVDFDGDEYSVPLDELRRLR